MKSVTLASKKMMATSVYAVLKGYTIPVGSRIKFAREKISYTVQASSERYVVCTKPFAALKTVLYSIIDFERGVRGREGLVFCMGFENRELCQEALQRLITGESEVSFRHCRSLDLEKITFPEGTIMSFEPADNHVVIDLKNVPMNFGLSVDGEEIEPANLPPAMWGDGSTVFYGTGEIKKDNPA